MITCRVGLQWGLMTVSIWAVLIGAGCASRQVASTSGDQSMTLQSKTQPDPVDGVTQDPHATVDTGGPSLKETAGQSPAGSSAAGTGLPPSPSQTQPPRAQSSADLATLHDIYFDFDRYSIRRDAQATLDVNASLLRTESDTSVVVEGHCDERGTLAYNLVLGEKRAKAVKRYLEDLGIPGSRIQTTSYGEVRPFCKEHNDGCWSKNRRAHFVIR
jgi:peptidoglycan-associated lipoprotein